MTKKTVYKLTTTLVTIIINKVVIKEITFITIAPQA